MHTNNLCRVCGKDIRPGVTICESCRDERIYYGAMVSTNKKRLKQTLNERRVTREWLDKVANQSNTMEEEVKVIEAEAVEEAVAEEVVAEEEAIAEEAEATEEEVAEEAAE